MKQKLLHVVPLLLVIFLIAFRYWALVCTQADSCTIAPTLHLIFLDVIKPLNAYAMGFALGAFVLLFVERTIFDKWLRFAVWWIPLSVILIALTPSTSGQWLPLYFIGKSLFSLVMGGIFSVVTLLIVVRVKSQH